ncbi:MAG: asparaginase domain-containing protein [Eubacterium sp.]|nr:asparaginase domain-containing protein [Eubacterium sp.]
MDKILVIGTGGTIGSIRGDNIHLDKPFKILDYMNFENIEFDCVSPFTVLSENMSLELWEQLTDYIGSVDFCKYKGIIVLHGSDTLSFTGALLANMFYDSPIILVASDKPVEDKSANGIKNFENAVEYIQNGINRVYISYDGIYEVENNKPLKNPVFKFKKILVIFPYVGIDYNSFDLSNVDIVLHSMYHSATAPAEVNDFIRRCTARRIKFYFVTENSSADYESARNFENIIFNSTIEGAYARLLLTN